LLLFVFSGIIISFFSAGWSSGTKDFDLNFQRNPFDASLKKSEMLQPIKLLDVANYLAERPAGLTRVIGLTPPPNSYLLPKRYESILDLSWSLPSIFSSSESFIDYLHKAQIQFIILPRDISANDAEKCIDVFRKAWWEKSNYNTLWNTIKKSDKTYSLHKEFDGMCYDVWKFTDL